jgi:hypothetical protein
MPRRRGTKARGEYYYMPTNGYSYQARTSGIDFPVTLPYLVLVMTQLLKEERLYE